MFNFITTAPDSTVLTSRSDVNASFKVLALKDGKWDSYASALNYAGAVQALNILSNKFSKKSYTKWEIVQATAVNYATWEALHNN